MGFTAIAARGLGEREAKTIFDWLKVVKAHGMTVGPAGYLAKFYVRVLME
jgi:hypothetical protein